MSQTQGRVEIDHALIARFDTPGPRYTSYPTADRFVEAFDAPAHATWLSRRNIGGFVRPLSLYVHLPFCASICYYCACNKVITRDHGRSAKYLRYLEKELHLQLAHLGGERRLSQLHFGGVGVFLPDAALRRLPAGTARMAATQPGVVALPGATLDVAFCVMHARVDSAKPRAHHAGSSSLDKSHGNRRCPRPPASGSARAGAVRALLRRSFRHERDRPG